MKRIAIGLHVVGSGVIAFGLTRWIIWHCSHHHYPIRARLTSEDYFVGLMAMQGLVAALLAGGLIIAVASFLWSTAKAKRPTTAT